MTDSTHFVAQIKLDRVVKRTNQDRQSASHGAVQRDVAETLNITLKDTDLEKLKGKIQAHVSLVDESDL